MDDPTRSEPAPPAEEQQSLTGAAPGAGQQGDVTSSSPADQPAAPPSASVAPPTYPGMPGVPLSWAQPAAPTTPYGSAPAPDVPVYPVYPAVPSVPLGSPIQGAYPTYPGYPASYPGYPNSPSTPLSPYGAPLTVPPQTPGSPLLRALAEPFPAWLSAALGLAAVALVIVAFLASVLVGQVDWADAASTAGQIAIVLAILALIVAIVRGALGRRAIAMVVLSALLVVGLTARRRRRCLRLAADSRLPGERARKLSRLAGRDQRIHAQRRASAQRPRHRPHPRRAG